MPIIRYNWLQGGNRQVDLVESYNVGYAFHPDYRQAFVYGNLFYEDQTVLTTDSTEVIRLRRRVFEHHVLPTGRPLLLSQYGHLHTGRAKHHFQCLHHR